MPCCGRIPFELPADDQLTPHASLVTCSTPAALAEANAGAAAEAAAAEAADAVTASGGMCAPPISPLYDIAPGGGWLSRPASETMPKLTARRGGIRYYVPPQPWEVPDRGFGGYRPFPEVDARVAEVRRRAATIRRRVALFGDRVIDAWSVLTGQAEAETVRESCRCAFCHPDPFTSYGIDDDEDDDE